MPGSSHVQLFLCKRTNIHLGWFRTWHKIITQWKKNYALQASHSVEVWRHFYSEHIQYCSHSPSTTVPQTIIKHLVYTQKSSVLRGSESSWVLKQRRLMTKNSIKAFQSSQLTAPFLPQQILDQKSLPLQLTTAPQNSYRRKDGLIRGMFCH